jgi:hypothetical protein
VIVDKGSGRILFFKCPIGCPIGCPIVGTGIFKKFKELPELIGSKKSKYKYIVSTMSSGKHKKFHLRKITL